MSEASGRTAKDWAGNLRAYALAWGVPSLAIIAGSLVDPLARSAIWVVALIWMSRQGTERESRLADELARERRARNEDREDLSARTGRILEILNDEVGSEGAEGV